MQDLKWVVPYHEGSVRYFKEVGIWTDDVEAHNQALIARQNLLAGAWSQVDKSGDADSFKARWMEERRKVLEANNLPVVFN